MSTLRVTNLVQASSGTNNIVLDDKGNATVANTLVMGSSFKRNKIINGDMRVDQRNAGASVTPGSGVVTYTVDRWNFYVTQSSKLTVQQNAGSVTPPTGFTNYLGVTSSSAYSITASDIFIMAQQIEGLNMSDLAWGTANAKTVTLSFWVRSSLTGTFSGSIMNSAQDRSYSFSYSITNTNTWEQKTITIAPASPGNQDGTWLTNNGIGMYVYLGLGIGSNYNGTLNAWNTGAKFTVSGATSVVGTNGATFYITGVQLEVGSVATPYERQIYSEQLAQCQRYCYISGIASGANNAFMAPISFANSAGVGFATGTFPVTMRSVPSLTLNLSVGNYGIYYPVTAAYSAATSIAINGVTSPVFFLLNVGTGGTYTAGYSGYLAQQSAANGAYLIFSAEL